MDTQYPLSNLAVSTSTSGFKVTYQENPSRDSCRYGLLRPMFKCDHQQLLETSHKRHFHCYRQQLFARQHYVLVGMPHVEFGLQIYLPRR
jgi:hypothetical protein